MSEERKLVKLRTERCGCGLALGVRGIVAGDFTARAWRLVGRSLVGFSCPDRSLPHPVSLDIPSGAGQSAHHTITVASSRFSINSRQSRFRAQKTYNGSARADRRD